MKLTVNGVEYERRPADAGTKAHWRHGVIAVGPVASAALEALANARHQAAEILQSTTEAMRHARTEINRWKRISSDAREVLRRIDDSDVADSQDRRAIRSWCASFDAASVDL